MNNTINSKCPVCGAFPLMLEASKRSGYNTYSAVSSVQTFITNALKRFN